MQARIIKRQAAAGHRGPYYMPNVTISINDICPFQGPLLASLYVQLKIVVAVFWKRDSKGADTPSLRMRLSTQCLLEVLDCEVEQ